MVRGVLAVHEHVIAVKMTSCRSSVEFAGVIVIVSAGKGDAAAAQGARWDQCGARGDTGCASEDRDGRSRSRISIRWPTRRGALRVSMSL